MTREAAENVAHVASILAQQPVYRSDHGNLSPVPPHVAAREAIALAALAKRVHRFAERMCNEDIGEALQERTAKQQRDKAIAILARFGLAPAMQMDPRGWPLAILPTPEAAKSWEYNGEPRELVRVTPHA